MKSSTRYPARILVIASMVIVASCNMLANNGTPQSEEESGAQYSTVSALLTETAWGQTAFVQQESVDEETQTARVQAATITPIATQANADQTPSPNQGTPGSAISKPCDLAQAGVPIDISIPDDTRLHPGEYFSKTWRLVNIGSCIWDTSYSIVWFSGDALGLVTSQSFGNNIRPGEPVDITVEMIAPLNPGTYQSNWKLRNGRGGLFGIGPDGNAPFWTRIVVVPVDTPTPTPTLPLATPTEVVLASGALELSFDQSIDLDSGLLDQGDSGDLIWTAQPADELVLTPLNGASISLYGINAPSLSNCLNDDLSKEPILFTQVYDGAYLCYRTTKGLPGWLLVEHSDIQEKIMNIKFQTWAVP